MWLFRLNFAWTDDQSREDPTFNSRSVKSIQAQMKQNPSGFDPKKILKSGSSNVISSFCLNESYDFGDSEQMQILQWTESYFEKFRDLYLISGLAQIYPDFITRYGISRKILTFFKVSARLVQIHYMQIFACSGFGQVW